MAIDLNDRKKRPLIPPIFWSLAFIMLLGFFLRLYHIDAFSFWTDEGLTPVRSGYSIGQILTNQIIIQNQVTIDTHPPLYYLLIHFSRQILGESDFAYRFPSAVSSLLLVPLMYQFGKRLHSSKLGLIAATLTAINPLHIWYSHESRMYSVYILLMAGASLLLWLALQAERQEPIAKKGFLYLLLAGLALYTNYTAVFLIAVQALFWVWLFWQRGQRRLIATMAIVGVAAAIPLIPYTIPRLLTGTEANFFYVPPFIMLQDVFRFFSLGVTFTFSTAVLQWMTLFAFILFLLGLLAVDGRVAQLFLLGYLFAVVFGLMAGSLLIKPMYQGARHIMVGSPAFILLISWGLLHLGIWAQKRENTQASSKRLLPNALLILFTLLAFFGPFHALRNLFFNTMLAKDDFRSAIAFVEKMAGGEDVVVYNNAVLLPLHTHYQTRPDIGVTASPLYGTLARDSSAEQLTQLAQRYGRIWFVTDPPSDKRDEDKLVQQWLDTHLKLVDRFAFHARTTELFVLVYRTSGFDLEQVPKTAVLLETNWPNFPRLQAAQLSPPPAAGQALWLDLYWAAEFDLELSQKIRLALVGPDTHEWAISNQRIESLPEMNDDVTSGSLFQSSHWLPLSPGMPPGEYRLTIQPLDANDQLIGEQVATPLHINHPLPYVSSQPIARINEHGLTLQEFELVDLKVRPGHNLPVRLYWQANDTAVNPSQLIYELTVLDSSGQPLRRDINKVGPDWLDKWPLEKTLRENNNLYIYPETQPGAYTVWLQVRQGDRPLQIKRPFSLNPQEQLEVGRFTVEPWPLLTEMPSFSRPIAANFGPFATLAGADIEPRETAVDLTLYWQTQAEFDNNYLLFMHLVDAQGNIAAQIDQIPVNGLRPTGGWRPGEVLIDTYQLPLPPELDPGTYQINIGFYLPDTAVRLPVSQNETPQPDNQLVLYTVEIRE